MDIRTALAGTVLLGLSASNPVLGLQDFSYQAGSDLGRALYCGEAGTREFAHQAEAFIHRAAISPRQRSDAMRLFHLAAQVRAEYGPINQSCTEFRSTYTDARQTLRQQLRTGASH